jgi:predicted glycosyltransferase
MAIANYLRDANTNVLILTGSPIAGRFQFPQQVDFVRIPGMIKKTNDDYQSLSIRIEQEKALAVRTNIILATAQTFQPNLFIVDKEPLGLKREVLPTLEWFKESSPSTVTILGLRDILDDSEVIQDNWREKNVYSYLDRLYDEIWIYGNQDIYDPIEMYKIPKKIHERIQFTGYIPRKKHKRQIKYKIRKRYRIKDEDNFILVTTGGGGDGYDVIDRYLAMHEYYPTSLPFKSIIITGPFMPTAEREQLESRSKRFGIKIIPFHPEFEALISAADLVISMGGYNTICEILTQQTPSLIIPRETPRKEQIIRAKRLKNKGLLDFIPLKKATPQQLRENIFSLLHDQQQYKERIDSFDLSGLDKMLARLRYFKETDVLKRHPN